MSSVLSTTLPGADFVIVGAGPIGLWTAIQLKKKLPDAKVSMHERHETYIRSHVLRLDSLSVFLYSEKNRSEREKVFYSDIGLSNYFLTSPKGPLFIRTNKLEQALRSYALDLGVCIHPGLVTTPEALQALYVDAKAFIAADGAHSLMRKALLAKDDIIDLPLQHILELKYESAGFARSLSFVKEVYKTQKIMSHLGVEYVGRSNGVSAPVTLRLFLTDKEYACVPDASFKSPLMLETAQLSKNISDDLKIYMNVREQHGNESYVPETGKLTKLTLSIYRAKKFCILHNEKNWFLVGDAAFGVPYFRALNGGMLTASLLVNQCLKLYSRSASPKRVAFAYNWFATSRFYTEYCIARTKHTAISCYDLFRKISGIVPWQTVKWSEAEAFLYRQQAIYSRDTNK
jgi:2-polyprenyl-6-methoxyphenol hydroxylase-like FAD-dependent oxidoreductase